jgi:hypothetical protein
MKRFLMIGDALSQLLNVLSPFWPYQNTNPNESVSGRAYREGRVKLKKAINTLFFWQEDHCKEAFEKDLQRARNLLSQYED